MLPWPLIPLLALPWLAAPTVELTEATWSADCGSARPWRAWVQAPGPGYVLARLEGDPQEDVDMGLVGAAGLRLSLSHRGTECALLEVSGPMGVAVWSSDGAADDARLRLTWIPEAQPLAPGETSRGALDPDAARLYRVESPIARRCRVRLQAEGPQQGLTLLVLDPGLELLDARPAGARVALQVGPGAERYLVVHGQGALRLSVRTPGKGVKSFPPAPLDTFLDELAATPEQRVALAALRRNPDFQAIRAYLLDYPGGSPLRLRVAPGLRVRGAERFGSFSRGRLTINPTIEGHTRNVQELMDTLIHELIHALQALPRAEGFPLGLAVLDMPHDPQLGDLDPTRLRRGGADSPLHRYLEREYGPSASNPEQDYIDVNAGAQRLIAKVIEDNLRRTGLGAETLVFQNIRARRRLAAGAPKTR